MTCEMPRSRSGIAPATPRSGLQPPRRGVARMHDEDLASLLLFAVENLDVAGPLNAEHRSCTGTGLTGGRLLPTLVSVSRVDAITVRESVMKRIFFWGPHGYSQNLFA